MLDILQSLKLIASTESPLNTFPLLMSLTLKKYKSFISEIDPLKVGSSSIFSKFEQKTEKYGSDSK